MPNLLMHIFAVFRADFYRKGDEPQQKSAHDQLFDNLLMMIFDMEDVGLLKPLSQKLIKQEDKKFA